MKFTLPYQIDESIQYLMTIEGEIEISSVKQKRSNLQNRYYWAVLNCISNETGNDKDALHEFFKHKFLDTLKYQLFGQFIYYKPTTTKLTKTQFTDYIEKIAVFVSDFGIPIPRPESEYFEEFLKHYADMI